MSKSCNYILDNNERCPSTFQLHEFYFRDPNDSRNCSSAFLCAMHYDLVIKELNEELVTMKRLLDNKIWQDHNERKIARQNDVNYQVGALQYSIQSLREKYRTMGLNQCRNYFCKTSLSFYDKTRKIFSVTTFKPNGKRQHTFYLCSIKCFNIIKGKCGISTSLNMGQHTLETMDKIAI